MMQIHEIDGKLKLIWTYLYERTAYMNVLLIYLRWTVFKFNSLVLSNKTMNHLKFIVLYTRCILYVCNNTKNTNKQQHKYYLILFDIGWYWLIFDIGSENSIDWLILFDIGWYWLILADIWYWISKFLQKSEKWKMKSNWILADIGWYCNQYQSSIWILADIGWYLDIGWYWQY